MKKLRTCQDYRIFCSTAAASSGRTPFLAITNVLPSYTRMYSGYQLGCHLTRHETCFKLSSPTIAPASMSTGHLEPNVLAWRMS